MNIFPIEGNLETDQIDWLKSAQSHDNLRLNKMILESCQLLCTTLNVNGIKSPYKSFNPKHPSCLWTAESLTNYIDLCNFTSFLIHEKLERTGKRHKCKDILSFCIQSTNELSKSLKNIGSTKIKMAMPEEFKTDKVIESYRKYWISKPNMIYPENKIPDWFLKERKLPFKVLRIINGKPKTFGIEP